MTENENADLFRLMQQLQNAHAELVRLFPNGSLSLHAIVANYDPLQSGKLHVSVIAMLDSTIIAESKSLAELTEKVKAYVRDKRGAAEPEADKQASAVS